MSRLMTKPTKCHVRPAKTQISVGFRPVWSVFACAQWVAKDPSFFHADSEDWSDRADAKADLSLRWEHMTYFWFCHEAYEYALSRMTIWPKISTLNFGIWSKTSLALDWKLHFFPNRKKFMKNTHKIKKKK